MNKYDDIQWDVISPANYDRSFFRLALELRPLLYLTRRYRACSEGLVIEGWFYALPIGFNAIHSMTRIITPGWAGGGHYYAGSAHNLIRLQLHDSIKPTFIGPEDRDTFYNYCAQHIVRKKPSHKASPTRHGVLQSSATAHKAGETHHGHENQGKAPSGKTKAT